MFQLGREITHEVQGKRWTFSRLERSIVEDFRDWIAECIGDPFADVLLLLDKLPADQAKEMIAEAKETKKQLQSFSIGCPLAQRFLQTELGMSELAWLLLRDKHPEITKGKAFEIMAEIGMRAMADTVAKVNGTAPGKNAEAPAAVA